MTPLVLSVDTVAVAVPDLDSGSAFYCGAGFSYGPLA